MPGRDLLRFAGTIEAEDLIAIEKAIHEGCEKVTFGLQRLPNSISGSMFRVQGSKVTTD